MASIEVPVSDEKILAHLRSEHGFSEGTGPREVSVVEVRSLPRVANSRFAHEVIVQVTYPLELGEIQKLVDF